MPMLAKGIIIFFEKNKFKKIFIQDKEKALRVWNRCLRKGWDAQWMY